MATNPMLQAVLLFQNHQTTSPFLPHPGTINPLHAMEPVVEAARPKDEKTEDVPPFDTEEEAETDEPEENGEEDSEEEKNS